MITSVYGKCDNYDVVFKQEGGVWRCCIPPDWTDGQYVCEFYAVTDAGVQGYWTGILYISAGNVYCPKLVEDAFRVWVLPDRCGALEPDRITCTIVRREHNGADNVTA